MRESPPPPSGGCRRHGGAIGVQQLAESWNVALNKPWFTHIPSSFKELIAVERRMRDISGLKIGKRRAFTYLG